jgi:hypothetical protein
MQHLQLRAVLQVENLATPGQRYRDFPGSQALSQTGGRGAGLYRQAAIQHRANIQARDRGYQPLYMVIVRVGGYQQVHRRDATGAQKRHQDTRAGVAPLSLVGCRCAAAIDDDDSARRGLDNGAVALSYIKERDPQVRAGGPTAGKERRQE